MSDIKFRSVPENYRKERIGIKPNTIRKIDFADDRFKILKNWSDTRNSGAKLTIEIENTETGESFERTITDYTEWQGWAIISWNPFTSEELSRLEKLVKTDIEIIEQDMDRSKLSKEQNDVLDNYHRIDQALLRKLTQLSQDQENTTHNAMGGRVSEEEQMKPLTQANSSLDDKQ